MIINSRNCHNGSYCGTELFISKQLVAQVEHDKEREREREKMEKLKTKISRCIKTIRNMNNN